MALVIDLYNWHDTELKIHRGIESIESARLRSYDHIDLVYEKAITFAFNSVVKNENEVTLACWIWQIVEFLEIDNADAEALMDVMLKLIFYFSKYRATTLELDICLEAT